ncbi:unnamed protein product [Natator depressus]
MKKHKNWRRAEDTGGGDKDSLETEADEAESGLDVARAWTSQHTYLRTSALFVSHTLSFCQELLSPPWLKPTCTLSKGQSDRKKREGKQKHKQLGTQSEGGGHLQSQETEGADGRNEKLGSSKRLKSSSALDMAQNEKKKHCTELTQRKWRRQENEGGGDAQRLESGRRSEVGFTEGAEGMCWQNEDTPGMGRLELGKAAQEV